MNKADRQKVFDKYGGLCAYTGKPLDDKWQVDHMRSKTTFGYSIMGECKTREEYNQRLKEVDHIDNLMPAVQIINHYKRGHHLESFREYMLSFHKRLAKLPKTTSLESTKKRIEYMNKVADLFGITADVPFCGVFFFETLTNNQ